MATVIKLKRGTTTPTTSNIVSGEIAVDTSAQKFYINDDNTIKTIGLGNPSVSDISDLTATAAELNILDGVTATAAELNLLDGVTGTLVTEAGTQTLTNKTLTTPKIASGGYIADANGNEQIVFTTTASAVNYFTVTNTATGANQINLLGAAGSDTNIGIGLSTKGTGNVQIGSGISAGANPSRKLQIQPDSASKSAIGIQAYGATSTEKAKMDFFASNGTALTSIGQGAATSELFRLDSVSGYIFATGSGSHAGGTERVRIDSSGNVGIGDSTPSYKLDVTGDINYTGTLYNNGVASGSPAQVLIKNSSGTTIKIRVGLNAGGTTTNIKNSAGTALKTAVGPFISGEATF